LGLLAESLGYDSEDYTRAGTVRHMQVKRDRVWQSLRYVTHVAAVDELDAERLHGRQGINSVWPQAVPARFLQGSVGPARDDRALFSGSLTYGRRQQWLDDPALKPLLEYQHSSEDGTFYPLFFDLLHAVSLAVARERRRGEGVLPALRATLGYPLRWPSVKRATLSAYLPLLRRIRRQCFRLWLAQLSRPLAVVNLPGYLRAYSGRVYEGMAAGRPVVSWDIPRRPMNRALFEEGREILLYSPDRPDELANALRFLRSHPERAEEIGARARRKIATHHTVEHRVSQLLRWIQTGALPHYYQPGIS